MTESEIWNEWVEHFDVFISYSRKDNEAEPHMISAFVEQLEADFLRFSPTTPLKPFFDKKSILDGQYWQNEIRKGLRQSKVMVAFLSEAYFRSEWCRKEWEEYILVEQSRTYPGEALTPIFIVAPPDLDKQVPPSARDWWDNITSRNAVVEIQPFWPQGRAALQQEIVAQRLLQLEQSIRERVEHGRILARVPRDIRTRNPNFVGRRQELAALRDALSRHDMVGLCAVNGVGGIGKSSVAREYAYLFRKEYLGGQFEIDLSVATSIADVQSALVRIARSYLHAEIPYQLPEDKQYTLAKDAFHQLPPGEMVLLLLDNLNEDATAIVSRKNRDLFPTLEKVHMLVTTRAEPRSLGGIETISLDILPVSEALDLLFRYRAFARRLDDPDYLAARAGTYPLREDEAATGDDEWKASLAIVQRLGRHSLAVALVGAYLGSYPDITYPDFAAQLQQHGIGLALDAAGHDERVQNLIAHPVTLIGPLFEQSVACLSPLALRTLEYAALLPPDLVPLAWLKQLVADDADMAAALQPRPFQPPPWEETLRTLAGLDYLKGEPLARMHRVVQEVILARLAPAAAPSSSPLPPGEGPGVRAEPLKDPRSQRTDRVRTFIEQRTIRGHGAVERYTSVAEVDAIVQYTLAPAQAGHPQTGRTAMWIVPQLQTLGRLKSAVQLATLAEQILRPLAESDPANAAWQRDLSISLEKLGDLATAQGNLPEAQRFFGEYHRIAQQLVESDPENAAWQRDLSVSLERLGNLAVAQGNLPEAQRLFDESLRIRQRLAESDPANAEWQRDLSVSLEKLGDLATAQGNLPEAQRLYGESLRIAQRLAESDPANAQWQYDLGISNERLGDVASALGDLAKAHTHYLAKRNVIQRLAESDPANAAWQRDLSVSLDKLGDLATAQGNLPEAQRFFGEYHRIAQQLADSDPANAAWKRDLSVSLSKLGDLAKAQGNLPEAQRFFGEYHRIAQQLADSDPANESWQRDLSISLERLGNLATAQGNLPEAQRLFGESLRIRRQLAESDPANAAWQRDLAQSHCWVGNVYVAKGDLDMARESYENYRRTMQQLADSDPANASWQRDLSISLERLGNLAIAQGNLPEAQRLFGESLRIRQRLAESDPANAEWQRDLSISLEKLASVSHKNGHAEVAIDYQQQALAISTRLAKSNPTSAELRRTVWVHHIQMAQFMASGNNTTAKVHWRKAHDILAGMVSEGLFVSPQDKQLLNQLRAMIAPQ